MKTRFGHLAARLTIPAIAVLALAGCQFLPLPTSASATKDIGGPAGVGEPVASAQHAQIVANYGGIYHSDQAEQLLARIVARLVEASDDPSRRYRITILNSPAVNAFALPDGFLYVTRGLLALADDSSQVAAVLAHEMAHVTANHAAQREAQARTAIIVSRVVTDVLADSDAGQLALASSQRTLASFSRQQELDADSMGIKTIVSAGYDPLSAARFLSAMNQFQRYRTTLGGAGGRQPEFLATHPSTPERVDLAAKAAKSLTPSPRGDIDRAAYAAAIEGIVFGDDTGQGYVRGRSFFHAGLGVGFTVPEGFVLDNTADAVLATGGDGTALRFDAVDVQGSVPLEDYLTSGWVNGLDRGTVKVGLTGGLPSASAVATAKGWAFHITIVRGGGGETYRFIFANERDSPAFQRAAAETVSSFRQLSSREVASLRPLHVRLVTVKAGDSQETIAGRMKGIVERPLDLFRALNQLPTTARLEPGQVVKIVAE
ncbi:MAG: M48 family metalloprotease [Bauldia sp.]